MVKKFSPHFNITPRIVHDLMRIEALREKAATLPLTPLVLASLRETAKLFTTHYSTMIEGNRLEPEQIKKVIEYKGHFPGRERDEHEVRGYYQALTYIEQSTAKQMSVSKKIIQTLHALVMSDGHSIKNLKLIPYRDGQNVIKDSRTREIIYLPPEAKDVPELMKEMVAWINAHPELPCPIVASIAHYQCATIHPYYDGNGRTARLLTTLILHKGGYDLKGLYSLEEYYARHLDAYYQAITIGDSHNYYLGRADADITKWIEYFITGMATSFENVVKRMSESDTRGLKDQSHLIRKLDPRQRKVIELFQSFETITAKQIGELFGFKDRTSAQTCKDWVEDGFLEMVNFSNKKRSYKLAEKYQELILKK